MKRSVVTYTSEAALCADFLAWVRAEAGQTRYDVQMPAWQAYAETAGWDILLVGEDGTQIGIQAKLRFNLKVLHQAIPGSWDTHSGTGPDYRAILVPHEDATARDLCGALGLTVFSRRSSWCERPEFLPYPTLGKDSWATWHYWGPERRCELPDYIPDVPAGASGPRQLTKWKVKALRLLATLSIRGYLTRQDFRSHGVDPRPWVGPAPGWLRPVLGTSGQYVLGPHPPLFDAHHPEVYAQVLADTRKKLCARRTRISIPI